MMKIKLALDDL